MVRRRVEASKRRPSFSLTWPESPSRGVICADDRTWRAGVRAYVAAASFLQGESWARCSAFKADQETSSCSLGGDS